ncbi:MAG TPA: cupredoxin domain-containing protein [Aggregicoccus sp.]|nr:cupredoxin domain-containing protein [Aggregicoccus sp.]
MHRLLPALLCAALLAACQKPEPPAAAVEAHAPSGGEAAVHEPRGPDSPLPSGAVRVEVGAEGFEPARIPVKAGQSVQLAFHRAADGGCGDRVVFPALKLERALPVGQTVLVQVLAPKSGELAFTCGMDMLRGAVVVQ